MDKIITKLSIVLAAAYSTLLNRALNLPSTAEGVKKELTYVSNALKSYGYPSATISNILKKKSTSEVIPSPEELVGIFFLSGQNRQTPKMASQFYHTSKV